MESNEIINFFKLKLMELENTYKMHISLQEKKDLQENKEIEVLKALLVDQYNRLKNSESENQRMKEMLAIKDNENKDLRNELNELKDKMIDLNNQVKYQVIRYENLQFEHGEYIKNHSRMSKKLKDLEWSSEANNKLFELYKKKLFKVNEELEEKLDLRDQYIQDLLDTLKQMGIFYRSYDSNSYDNIESNEDEVPDDDRSLRLGYSYYEHPNLPTVFEEDETDEDPSPLVNLASSTIMTKFTIFEDSEGMNDSGHFTDSSINSRNDDNSKTDTLNELKEIKKANDQKKKPKVGKKSKRRRYTRILFVGCL